MGDLTLRCEDVLAALRQGTVNDALGVLNRRVPHRYTGIYRLRDGLLTNVFICDKRGETAPEALAVVPLNVSFCQFVLRDGLLRSDDTALDHRLDGNPHQGVVMAYHGVPLLDAQGGMYGTLCHFDMEPWGISDAEFAYLQEAALVIAAFLPQD